MSGSRGERRGHILKVKSMVFADGWIRSQRGSEASARSSWKVELPLLRRPGGAGVREELGRVLVMSVRQPMEMPSGYARVQFRD